MFGHTNCDKILCTIAHLKWYVVQSFEANAKIFRPQCRADVIKAIQTCCGIKCNHRISLIRQVSGAGTSCFLSSCLNEHHLHISLSPVMPQKQWARKRHILEGSLPLSGIKAGTDFRIWSDKCFARLCASHLVCVCLVGLWNGFQATAAHRAGSIQNLWAHQLKWKCLCGWEGEEAGATQTSGWCPISHICPESLPQLKPPLFRAKSRGWQWQGESVGLPAAAHVKNVAHRWQPMCSDSCMEGLAPFFSSLPLIALRPAALQLWGEGVPAWKGHLQSDDLHMKQHRAARAKVRPWKWLPLLKSGFTFCLLFATFVIVQMFGYYFCHLRFDAQLLS